MCFYFGKKIVYFFFELDFFCYNFMVNGNKLSFLVRYYIREFIFRFLGVFIVFFFFLIYLVNGNKVFG